jgi:hypothetical protein
MVSKVDLNSPPPRAQVSETEAAAGNFAALAGALKYRQLATLIAAQPVTNGGNADVEATKRLVGLVTENKIKDFILSVMRDANAKTWNYKPFSSSSHIGADEAFSSEKFIAAMNARGWPVPEQLLPMLTSVGSLSINQFGENFFNLIRAHGNSTGNPDTVSINDVVAFMQDSFPS